VKHRVRELGVDLSLQRVDLHVPHADLAGEGCISIQPCRDGIYEITPVASRSS
jgi:hypothetical protein